MLRLRIGDATILVDAEMFAAIIEDQAPRWLLPRPDEVQSRDDVMSQIAMRQAVRTVLWWMRRSMRRAGAEQRLIPEVPRGADPVLYAIGWILAFASEAADQFDFEASYEPVEQAGPSAVAITGVVARPRLVLDGAAGPQEGADGADAERGA